MEVCGGHTHSIYKYGIDDLLPDNVELVHGPGCPVCVIPMGRVDDGIALAREDGRDPHLLRRHDAGARAPSGPSSTRRPPAPTSAWSTRRSTRCGSRRQNPDRDVVFFAIGFETTAPSTALTLKRAKAEGVENFLCMCSHVTIVPPLRALLESPDLRLDGFIGPGHVSTIVGVRPFEFIPADYGRPLVTAGLRAARHPAVDPDDPRPARRAAAARSRTSTSGSSPTRATRRRSAVMAEVFELRPHFEWRGLGFISQSALQALRRLRRLRRRASLRGPRASGSPTRRRASAARCSRA